MSGKACVKCNETKDIQFFGKDKGSKDGHLRICKLCRKYIQREYKLKNKEKIKNRDKKYREENKEIIKIKRDENKDKNKEYGKQYYLKDENKVKRKIYIKDYVLKNEESIKIKRKEYREKNKEIISIKDKAYRNTNKLEIKEKRKNRTRSNHEKISNRIRSRIRMGLKSVNLNKCISSSKLLGCSVDFFREYIESKFTKGMTWENWGLYGWHIDHIVPCASFDLSDLEQQKMCFNYSNLQPLWATTAIAVEYGEDQSYIGNLEKSKNDYRK